MNNKNKFNIKAFSLLECLAASSLMIVLFSIVTHGIFIIVKLNQKSDVYIKYLNNSQYLYWLFYNEINENIGVNNITDEVIINNRDNIVEKLIQNFYLNPEKVSISRKELLTTGEFINKYNLSKNIQNKILSNSTVLRIVRVVCDLNNNDLNKNGLNIVIEDHVYYIASRVINNKVTYGLYKYFNNYSDEIVAGVKNMLIKEVKINNKKYFYFEFEFELESFSNINNNNINNRINFMIPCIYHIN